MPGAGRTRNAGRSGANAAIARLQVVWGCATAAKWTFTLLVALYAYDQGGAAAVGVAALVRALPSVVAAPFLAVLVDRGSRVVALRLSCAARVGFALATAVAVGAGASLAFVLALAVGLTVADTAHRPAQAALLPQLARNPAELAAANVVWSVLDNAGFLVGSSLVGLLVATSGLASACWACVVLFVAALLAASTLRADPAAAVGVTPPDRQVLEGVRIIRADPRLRALLGIYGVDMLTQGLLDVLLVIAAIELLGLGAQGAGWLSMAWGGGGVLAGIAARVLLRRGRLATGLLVGCLLTGGSVVTVALMPNPVAGLVLLAVYGIGSGLIEIAHLTLTQRLVPADVLARVYGVQEVIDVGTTALGGIAAAGLVAVVGVDGALIVSAVLLPAAALVLWRRLRRMEMRTPVPDRAFEILHRLPIFAPLPVATVETLAVRARSERVAAGTDVITQGEPGETFYVVAAGTVEVVVDGVLRRTEGPGEYFGEIALLREVARTATVRARSPVVLLAVDRDEFLASIGSHVVSRGEVERVAEQREPRR